MATLKEEIEAIKSLQDGIVKNKVANFAYTDEAYTKNKADGVEIYDVNQSQNIPVPDPDVLKVNPTVLTKGYRAQAASVTRMFMNHFFGRTSYNLNKVNDFFLSLLTKLSAYLGTANGIATLDSKARVPLPQLQNVTDTKGQANGIATLDSNARVPLSQLRNVTDTKGQANGIATLDSNARVPLSQLQNITDTKGKANGIASLDSKARVPVEQLQNITDTKGKANGIASLDSKARVPVEQLQNVINDVSASGNKTYSSNKIVSLNNDINAKIDEVANSVRNFESKHIYMNYISFSLSSNFGISEGEVYLNIVTPNLISTLDDFMNLGEPNFFNLVAGGFCKETEKGKLLPLISVVVFNKYNLRVRYMAEDFTSSKIVTLSKSSIVDFFSQQRTLL